MKYLLIFGGLVVAGGVAFSVMSSKHEQDAAMVNGAETEIDLSGVCPVSQEEEPCE